MPSASGIGLKAELSKNRVWFGAQLFFAALITLYALTGISWLYKYGLMAGMLGLLLEAQNELQSDQVRYPVKSQQLILVSRAMMPSG